MIEQKFTLTEIATIMGDNKWHLIRLEDEIKKIGYGVIEAVLDIRGGAVEKITFISKSTELRPKKGHEGVAYTAEVLTQSLFGSNIINK